MVPVHAGLSGFSRTLGEPKASPSCAGNRGHGQQMSHRALTFSSTLTPPPLDSQWAPSRTRGLPRWAHHHDELLLLARPAGGGRDGDATAVRYARVRRKARSSK